MNRSIVFCILAIMSASTFASDYRRWEGQTITFSVRNNTSEIVTYSPGWGGDLENIPKFEFPEGTTVYPNSTIKFTINAPYSAYAPSHGELSTSVFQHVDNELISLCGSRILVSVNANNTPTFSLSEYSRNGLFVKSEQAEYSCYGSPVDFDNGNLTMAITDSLD